MSAPARLLANTGPSRAGGRRPQAVPAGGGDTRPLYTAGGIAAAWSAGIGLAVLTTLTVIGWVAAPHGTIGEDILDVLRTAVQAWLVGHLVGIDIPGGSVSMLPLGLVVLPGLLLYRTGRWLARTCELPRLRHLFRAALAIAGPYAAICGTLALAAQSATVRPDVVQALLAGFVLAFLAGGLGVLRQLLRDKEIARGRLLELMPARSRSLLVGASGAMATLVLSGTLVFGVALGFGFGDAVGVTRELSPGLIGGTLLVLAQLLYLPNAVVFGLAYTAGPGFSVGVGTMVAPTGVAVGPLPLLPMLAALPENGPAPAVSLVALAAPFVAGAVGGVLTQRSAPTVVNEAAPLWGVACGVATGAVCAALSALSGGSLGANRLTEVGPSAWQVGLVTSLEVGVAAAIAAWLANWWYLRRTGAARRSVAASVATEDDHPAAPDEDAGSEADTSANANEDPTASSVDNDSAPSRGRRRWCPRLPRLRRREGRAADDEDDLFGITYEADPDAPERDSANEPGDVSS